MTVVTRFAPSPTGFLHIGGARTALFNYLFAKANNGKFLLRIEDTDKKRSTKEAIDAILDSMQWLGLDYDGDVIYQSQRVNRHIEVANKLLDSGKAYRCYCTAEELQQMREDAMKSGKSPKYNGKWRYATPEEEQKAIEEGRKPSIRLKVPKGKSDGEQITIDDAVQGRVSVPLAEMDDMIILRSDNTPTYMLAAVVDDHDMKITHIIRGDDHLNNAFRQKMIYDAMGWTVPTFAHIPLIHGSDGAKLSKRHGAIGAEKYREMGYLPEAMCNYLLRLGWSHGDDEIINMEQAIKWFNLSGINKGAARFDIDKLNYLNSHYISIADCNRLSTLLKPELENKLKDMCDRKTELSEAEMDMLVKALPSLKQRAKLLTDIAEGALFYFMTADDIIGCLKQETDAKALKILVEDGGIEILKELATVLDAVDNKEWNRDKLSEICKKFAENKQLKLGKVMQPVRAAITASSKSPSMFEILELLGKDESLKRISFATARLLK